MRSPEYVLELTALSKSYRSENATPIAALSQFSLRVPARCVFGIVGGAGAGKTVLARLLCGLDAPSSGSLVIHGFDLQSAHDLALSQIAGLVDWRLAQEHSAISPREYVCASASTAAQTDYAARLLADLEIDQYGAQPLSQLPPTLRRELAIARMLVAAPPVIVFDEPTRCMDSTTALRIERWLVEHQRYFSAAIVLLSREIDLARRVCDRIALIHGGQYLAEISPLDLTSLLDRNWYVIQVQGAIDAVWSEWLDGFTVEHTVSGRTLLSGALADQAALYGLLNKLYDLGLPLLSVMRQEPDVQQIGMYARQYRGPRVDV